MARGLDEAIVKYGLRKRLDGRRTHEGIVGRQCLLESRKIAYLVGGVDFVEHLAFRIRLRFCKPAAWFKSLHSVLH